MAKNACNVAIEQEAETKKFGLGTYLLVAIRISRTSKIREEMVINYKILFCADHELPKVLPKVHCSPLELVSFVRKMYVPLQYCKLEILFKTTGT